MAFLTAIIPPSPHHVNLLSPAHSCANEMWPHTPDVPVDCPQGPDSQLLAGAWTPGLYQVRDRRVSADVKDGGAPKNESSGNQEFQLHVNIKCRQRIPPDRILTTQHPLPMSQRPLSESWLHGNSPTYWHAIIYIEGSSTGLPY
jgi:hypothetical protein